LREGADKRKGTKVREKEGEKDELGLEAEYREEKQTHKKKELEKDINKLNLDETGCSRI
jgi:hypothetical protein